MRRRRSRGKTVEAEFKDSLPSVLSQVGGFQTMLRLATTESEIREIARTDWNVRRRSDDSFATFHDSSRMLVDSQEDSVFIALDDGNISK